MNFLAFRYFLEIAKTLNFSEASKQLYVSQPGLSQQINALEKELGFKLLQRTTRKVSLTEEGEYLFKKLQPSFESIEKIISDITEHKHIPNAMIRIASVPSAASIWLPKLLKNMHRELPSIEFYLQETTSVQAIKWVKEQKSHIAFIRTPVEPNEIQEQGLKMIELTRHPMRCVLSKNHPLAKCATIDLHKLKNEPFIHYDPNQSPALYLLLEKACLGAGFVPNTLCVGPEILTIEKLIGYEVGVTLMPEDMVHLLNDDLITVKPIEGEKFESSISVVWEESEYTPFVTEQIVKLVRQLLADELRTAQ